MCTTGRLYVVATFLTVAVALFLPAFLHAQDTASPEGTWKGSINVPGGDLGVTVYLMRDGQSGWKGTIDIPQQGAKALPLTKIAVAVPDITFAIMGIPGEPTFKGKLSGNTLAGSFLQGGGTIPFSLRRETAQDSVAATGARAASLKDIEDFITIAMKDWNVPGLSLAIVKNGEVILTKGFGYRDEERKLPVTSQTLFPIGSSTKAFTSFIIASLVDEGKLEWDKRVVEYLPDFRLKDPIASSQMTPRDLLLHISGLPRHDVLWYASSLTRRELFERLQYLEPNADFRTKWQYQNLMYMTAGYLAEEVTGITWEELVRTRILEPLGMQRSNFSVSLTKKDSNAALPYEEKEGKSVLVDYHDLDQIGPAGSINSTAEDMANWVKLHLSDGSVNGRQVTSPEMLRTLQTPRVVISGGSSFAKELLFNLYGMGWFVQSYRGHRLVHHGGNIDGFTALVGMMPDDSVGIAILTNQDGSALPMIAMLTIYDKLLGFEEINWNERLKGQKAQAEAVTEEAPKTEDASRVRGTRPSHDLEAYAGSYEHPAYGTVHITVERDRLKLAYNSFSGTMEHFHYDVFKSGFPEPFSEIRVQFESSIRGDIDRLQMQLEPAVEPSVFKKLPPQSMTDSTMLARYAGEYSMDGITATVRLKGKGLIVTVPGQPTYKLVALREGEFALENLQGYSLRFESEGGKVVRVLFIQPNATFVATRKDL